MRKAGISIISFGLICAILLCILADFVWILPDDAAVAKEPFAYSGIDESRKYYGFEYISFAETPPSVHNTEVSYTDVVGISSYSVGDNVVTYEFCGGQSIVYNVYFNGELIYESVYFEGDMLVDMVFSGENYLNYFYDDGVLVGVTVNDGTIELKRDDKLNVTEIKLNNTPDHSYSYNESGMVTDESIGDQKLIYRYDGKNIVTDGGDARAESHGDTVKVIRNGVEHEYVFDYSYKGEKYVTSIRQNGEERCVFTYLNGNVTSMMTPTELYYYIVDCSGNYLGYVCDGEFFTFVYNGTGSVYGIIDSEGKEISFVNAGVYGEYSLQSLNEITADMNCIIYPDAVTDITSGNVIVPGGVILPDKGKKITLAGGALADITCDDSFLDNSGNELKLTQPTADLLFRDMVIYDAVKHFNDKGLRSEPYIDIINNNGHVVMTADIYTLDYSDSSDSAQNLLNGNQMYNVIYADADPELIKVKAELIEKIDACPSDFRAEYFGEFSVKKGSMKFGGQFVYLGYLITYNCDGNGIIYYSIGEACEENYKYWNNIYDYDNRRYVNYSEISFSSSIWDYTAIIPGLNREHYAAIEGFLDEIVLMQGRIEQEQLEYLDESFYSAEFYNDIGDTLDLYEEMMTEDQMLILASDGELTIKALPLWDSPSIHRSLLKIAGTVVVTLAVSAIITIAVPGSIAVVIPVLTGTMKSAVAGVIVDFCWTAATQINWTDFGNTDWDSIIFNSLKNAGNSFMIGAATGALSSTARAWKFNKSVDGLYFKSNKMRLQQLNNTYDSLLINDDMYAAMEYSRYKLSIDSGLMNKKAYEYIVPKANLKNLYKRLRNKFGLSFGKNIINE